jgi:RNA polymerase sigma-70 factor (ECF subfamily)
MAAEKANSADGDSSAQSDYDSILVEQAKAGESEVWEHWFDQYYQQLYSYAFLRTRRKADAEDIVAQVLLEAVKGINRYQYQGRPIIAWLFGIAHNLIADAFKRQQRRVDTQSTSTELEVAGEGLDGRIENLDLLLALDGLTDEQRDVIILRYFMGLGTKEIGDALGKSEAAVYSLQARGILALRSSMGGAQSI